MKFEPPPCGRIVAAPLVDPVVEEFGFPPDSLYVEHCWLPILGPTATWMYRRFALPLQFLDEIEYDLVDLSLSLGLGEGLGRHSKVAHALARMVRFGAADWGGTRLLVRRSLGPLSVLQASRLNQSARYQHETLLGEAASR